MKFFSQPRIKKTGDIDRANSFIGVAKKKIPALERFMSFQSLNQQRSIPYSPESGVKIWLSKVFGQLTINIHADSVAGGIVDAIKRILVVPIQVKRTNAFDPLTLMNTGVSFTKGLDWGVAACDYVQKPVPALITETFVNDFSQVRYKSGNITCSLIMYNYVIISPIASEGSTLWVRIRVVNEKGSANFSYHFETVDGWQGSAALSHDLQKLYMVLGTPTQGGTQGLMCMEYTLTPDQETGELGWVETKRVFAQDTENWDLRHVAVDRLGNCGGFMKKSYESTDIEADNTPADWKATGDCAGYSTYSHIETRSNSGNDVRFYPTSTFDINTEKFIASSLYVQTTVAKTDYDVVLRLPEYWSVTGHSFNYRYGRAYNECCSSGVPPAETFYPRRSQLAWGGNGQQYGAMTTHADYYFSALEHSISAFIGTKRSDEGEGEEHYYPEDICLIGGGYNWGWTTTFQHAGVLAVSANRSSIAERHDYTEIKNTNYLNSSWDSGWSTYIWYGYHPIAVYPAGPSVAKSLWDLKYPIEIDDIQDLANSFISYDEESGVCFFGVRYKKYTYSEYEWHYYCRPSVDSDPIEITASLQDTLGYLDQDFQTIECILFYNYEYEVAA